MWKCCKLLKKQNLLTNQWWLCVFVAKVSFIWKKLQWLEVYKSNDFDCKMSPAVKSSSWDSKTLYWNCVLLSFSLFVAQGIVDFDPWILWYPQKNSRHGGKFHFLQLYTGKSTLFESNGWNTRHESRSGLWALLTVRFHQESVIQHAAHWLFFISRMFLTTGLTLNPFAEEFVPSGHKCSSLNPNATIFIPKSLRPLDRMSSTSDSFSPKICSKDTKSPTMAKENQLSNKLPQTSSFLKTKDPNQVVKRPSLIHQFFW